MSLYRRANTPHWWVRFQLDGREIRLSSGTADRRQAEEFETLARNNAYRHIRLGERAAYPWASATKRWLSDRKSKRSLAKDKAIIRWIDAQLDPTTTVQEIDRELVDQMRALKAEETSESTANRYMALLRAILKRCVDDWKVLESAPKVPMYAQAEQEPRWLTPQEFSRLEAQLPPHLKAAAQFSVLTGLRMRSMLSLTWDQVDFKKKTAWVSASEMKAGKTLGIPLSIDAVNVLKKQPVVENVPWVFSWRSARIGDCNTKAFQDAVTRAKLGPLRWHDLRHTWASWAVQSGATLQQVMQLGGWKSLTMVMRYAHLAPDHLAAAAAKVRLPVQKPAQRKRSPKKRA